MEIAIAIATSILCAPAIWMWATGANIGASSESYIDRHMEFRRLRSRQRAERYDQRQLKVCQENQ